MTRHLASTLVETARAEGLGAVRDRALDRWREFWERQRGSSDTRPWPRVPVLNVLGVSTAARGGGVPLQLLARLREEAAHRTVALLSREPRGFELVAWDAGRVWRRRMRADAWTDDPLLDEPAWRQTVEYARALVGAQIVHVENAHGLSLPELRRLAESSPTVLSAHDFALFCRRPHLLQAGGAFCAYSTDPDRCSACLARAGHGQPVAQPAHRAKARALVRASAAFVCPSQFQLTTLSALLGVDDAAGTVISPGLRAAVDPPSERDPREVALLGGGADHKGGAQWSTLVRALTSRGLRATLYGGDGHHNLRGLRGAAGLRVRGYYRAGTLPSLLSNQRAAVAVLWPQVPESFSLTLSEAWAAGVPVVAPSIGAFAERLAGGGGTLLRANPTGAEVERAVDDLRQQPTPVLPTVPTAVDAARQHRALYQGLGVFSDW